MLTPIKPRRRGGARPVYETYIQAAYCHRAYRARDAMHLDARSQGDFHGAGHVDGSYCLDRADPTTGSHRAEDYVYQPEER